MSKIEHEVYNRKINKKHDHVLFLFYLYVRFVQVGQQSLTHVQISK